jgi:hypothetical protein
MGVAMNRTGMLPAAMTALEVLSERLTQLLGGLVRRRRSRALRAAHQLPVSGQRHDPGARANPRTIRRSGK